MQDMSRQRRVAALLKRELATLIARNLNDNRINSVTVIDVVVSKDLKHATIYVCSMNDRIPGQKIEQLLNKVSKYLRHLLSQKLDLRTTPSLLFRHDTMIQRGIEMSNLIDALNSPPQQT